MTLGKRISQYRKNMGLSQEALGEQLGVSRQAVSKWETDAAVPDMENLLALARVFGVSVAELTQTPEEALPADTASDTAFPSPQDKAYRFKRIFWPVACAVLSILLVCLLVAFPWKTRPETDLPVEVPEPPGTSGSTDGDAPPDQETEPTIPHPAPKTDFALIWYDSDGKETSLELGEQEGLFPFGRDLVLTEPEEVLDTDFRTMTAHRADCGGITIDYYHITDDSAPDTESTELETIWQLSTIVSDFRTPRGVHVGSTKAHVLAAYGDALVYCMKESDGYSLVKHDYYYALQTPETGGASLQLFMQDGLVAGICVEHMAEWGSEAFAPDRLSRFPLKGGEPDFSGREQPEQEFIDDTRAVYIAFNQLVTNNNLSAEERYTHRWTIFSRLAYMDWWAFGKLGSTENPDGTIAALLTWLREEAPYSEGEIFRLQMGCMSNLDGWLADSYSGLLSSALFADPAAFVKGLAYEGVEDCMSQVLRLTAHSAAAYPTERADAAAELQHLLDNGRFTDVQAAWAELLIQYLNTPLEDRSGLPNLPDSLS